MVLSLKMGQRRGEPRVEDIVLSVLSTAAGQAVFARVRIRWSTKTRGEAREENIERKQALDGGLDEGHD